MAKKPKDLRTKSDPAVEPDDSLLPDRNEELRDDEDIRHTALELMKDVEKSFDDQAPRVNEGFDNWDLYNCKLTSRQFYNGQSKNFVPLVHDAVNARNVRFTNQIFPQPGRHVEVTTEDGEVPNSLMALLDYYIRRARLRTEVMPALMRAGDCEGQYTIYVDWEKLTRHVVWRGEKEGQPPGHDLPNPVFSVEDIIEEEITSEGPVVEVIQDADFTVTPATARSLGHALAVGGAVTVIRRWSKAKIQSLVDEGKCRRRSRRRVRGLAIPLSTASTQRGSKKMDGGNMPKSMKPGPTWYWRKVSASVEFIMLARIVFYLCGVILIGLIVFLFSPSPSGRFLARSRARLRSLRSRISKSSPTTR